MKNHSLIHAARNIKRDLDCAILAANTKLFRRQHDETGQLGEERARTRKRMPRITRNERMSWAADFLDDHSSRLRRLPNGRPVSVIGNLEN